MFNDVKAVSRVASLTAVIEQSIVKRRLQPGDRVTTVAELREQTGLAKQTITETLRLLADRGVIEIRPGRNGGAFVASSNPVVRLRQTLLTIPDGATTVADAIAVRDALEPLICLDAARSRSTSDLKALQKLLGRMQKSVPDVCRFIDANWSLHERIAVISPNELASAVYLGTLRCLRELSVGSTSAAEQPARYLAERLKAHEDLIAAIAAGDEAWTLRAVDAHRGSFAVSEKSGV